MLVVNVAVAVRVGVNVAVIVGRRERNCACTSCSTARGGLENPMTHDLHRFLAGGPS